MSESQADYTLTYNSSDGKLPFLMADKAVLPLNNMKLRSRDVRRLAGLACRQINDWENRAGVIESDRTTADGWREFHFDEVAALAICGRVRDSFGVPLDASRK